MNAVRYTGINHLAMVTGDMDKTIRFWRDFLGMRLVAGLGTDRYRHYFLEISPQDMIAFFEWPEVENVPEKDHGVPVKGPFAFDHVSIGVATDGDLWELKGRFEAADMWVSEVIDHGFIHSIYAFDPNNIPIEFSAPVPGVDVRDQPRMLDRHPSIAAREGSDPIPGMWPPSNAQGERPVYPGEGRIFVDTGDGAGEEQEGR
jgi:catechol 2,3-dioxygenase-like lactoylglutathione lyase family enzyme